jgi:hypothetical protein
MLFHRSLYALFTILELIKDRNYPDLHERVLT